ncbi:MAG: nucleotidyltransferase family protein [Bacteroidales bacterium]|nr:nucleotidyltransferase family protein [Bacteroidales bacterium]
MKAMIFAAGLGTRLAPLTNSMPKAMVEIAGKPMLQIVIEKLVDNGFKYIVINTHHFANQIIEFVKNNDFGVEIHISDESDMLLDTGGGLKNAKKFFKPSDTFLVHNVDIYSDINLMTLISSHKNSGNIATLAVKHRKSTKYLLFDNALRLCGWKNTINGAEIISHERKTYDEMAFSGIYVFNYEIFDLLEKEGSFPIIPELLQISKKHHIAGWVLDDNFVLDIGKHEAISQLEKYFATKS